ncbi:MAG TPA: hypothetical protein VMQ65_09445 [Candidatus Limnocylindria bacterium]|nr:hypothetical protein [Candidatus Limnocylindria bacterium]
MRPEDRRADMLGSLGGDDQMPPLDMDLTGLDAELNEAGAQASRSLHGRTQPTRVFSSQLRSRMVGAYAASTSGAASGAAARIAGAATPPRSAPRPSRNRVVLEEPGEAWAPMPVDPRIARRTPASVMPRARWSLLAAAALTGVVAVGAIGARLDWLAPSPTAEPTNPLASLAAPAPDQTPRSSAAAVLPAESAGPVGPTKAPEPTPTKKPAATEPAPTKKPQPTPTAKPAVTPKPDPTAPPIGPMDLMAKACPGGVILDWTKPSTAVSHYHVLRSLDGDVPPTYPADGATEIDSATTWSAGATDGFDASVGGGKSATYRAFAFDAEDNVLAVSPSRTVSTAAAIDLGTLGFADNGDGSVTFTWAAASVNAACFTYGKLVASVDDANPSYVKGSSYLAAISDPGVTGVTLEGLQSGKTVWMRYELIRVTGTGKFVVGSTAVRSVTFP